MRFGRRDEVLVPCCDGLAWLAQLKAIESGVGRPVGRFALHRHGGGWEVESPLEQFSCQTHRSVANPSRSP
jgi:hypothetical protein